MGRRRAYPKHPNNTSKNDWSVFEVGNSCIGGILEILPRSSPPCHNLSKNKKKGGERVKGINWELDFLSLNIW